MTATADVLKKTTESLAESDTGVGVVAVAAVNHQSLFVH